MVLAYVSMDLFVSVCRVFFATFSHQQYIFIILSRDSSCAQLVEGAPKTVMKEIKKEDAEEMAKKLEELGAVVEIV